MYSLNHIFDANEPSQWRDGNITCDPSKSCHITCDERYACQGSTVKCPEDHQCTLNCSADYSCRYITIQPPQNQSLFILSFSGDSAMEGVKYPIYDWITNIENFTLICDKAGQCGAMNIICPTNGFCSIICVKIFLQNAFKHKLPKI